MKWKMQGECPEWKDISHLSSDVKAYWSQWGRINLIDGILYRKWIKDDADSVIWQLLLPRIWTNEVLQKLHNDPVAGHLGVSRTIACIRSRFFWSGYHATVRRWIVRCHECQSRKRLKRISRGKMQKYQVGAPME